MSRENVEIARQAHKAFNRPDLGVFDLDAFYRLADPDLVIDWSRSAGLEEVSTEARRPRGAYGARFSRRSSVWWSSRWSSSSMASLS